MMMMMGKDLGHKQKCSHVPPNRLYRPMQGLDPARRPTVIGGYFKL